MAVRLIPLLFVVLLFGVGCPTSSGYDGEDVEVPDPTWDDDVQPILAGYCDGCHQGDALGSGGHNWLDSYADVQAVAEAASCDGDVRGACIPDRIELDEMPLGGPYFGDEAAITEAQLETVKNWVAAGMPEN
jgi:hypothetical protein